MIEANINVSIGCYPISPQPENNALYSTICIDAVVKKEEIKKIQEQLTSTLGKNKLPFAVFQSSVKGFCTALNSNKEKEENYTKQELTINGKYYTLLEFKENDSKQMLKKVEKVFSQLTELNNQFNIAVKFYDVDKMHQKLKNQSQQLPGAVIITDRLKVQANLRTDANLVSKFQQLVKEISPEFANSPIMAVLPVLSQGDIDLELQSLNCLEADNLKLVYNINKYDKLEESIFQEAHKSTEDFKLYYSFGKLGFIRVSVPEKLACVLFNVK